MNTLTNIDFRTENPTSNYLSSIFIIDKVCKHPNADRLQIVNVNGTCVVTGLGATVGNVYVYIPVGATINHDFLSYTNSFAESSRNSDTKLKGFFNKQGRVKPVVLRGIPSEGYIIPLDLVLDWVAARSGVEINRSNQSYLEGTTFDTINGVLFCEKYVPPAARNSPQNNVKIKKLSDKKFELTKLIEGQFRFHSATANLRQYKHKIGLFSKVAISEKIHGTSFVVGKLLVKIKLPWWKKLAKLVGFNVSTEDYAMVYSSRNVIKGVGSHYSSTTNAFYPDDVWLKAAKQIYPSLTNGQTVYGEIAGFTHTGGYIQKPYSYGAAPKDIKVFIYRVTHTTPEGVVTEYDTNKVSNFCLLNNLNMVPLWFYGTVYEYLIRNYGHNYVLKHYAPNLELKEGSDDPSETFLKLLSKEFLEKDCMFHPGRNIPAEGVVVRVENDKNEIEAYKLKSFRFLQKESEELDNDTANIEDSN